MKYAMGLDIGGTKVAAAIIDENASILYRSEVPSDPSEKESMFLQVTKAIDMVFQESNLTVDQLVGIGVGVPGKVDQKAGIAEYQNNLPWRDFPIAKRIKDYLQIEKVIIDNDVYMSAFAEWNLNGANTNETFIYFTISTGISCSIMNRGDFIRGMGFAGEVGLLPVKSLSGIERLEKAASGPAIQQFTNNTLTTKEIFEKYQQRDEHAQTVVSNAVESIAHGCYAICCLLDPSKIVFGGGVINHNPFLLKLIQQKLLEHCIPEQKEIIQRMYVSKSKGDAGVLGAGLRVFHE